MNSYISKLVCIIAVLGIGASFSSCKKFLTERQVTNFNQEYYNTEDGLTNLINGLYVYSRIKHEWEVSGARLTEADTDGYMSVDNNWARYTSGVYGSSVATVAANNVTNSLGALNATFAPIGAYPHINNCNIALDIIDNVKPGKYGTDETFRKTRRAEILFLRTWAYYSISNQLGDIPIVLTARREDNGVYFFPKSKLEDVYKLMIADAVYAYDNLPATTTDRGRIVKWAAGHLLAKMYLNRAQAAGFQNSAENHLKMLYKGNVATDLDSCIYYASAVITGKGGAGALAPDYWTLFNPAVSESAPSVEVIWAAQFDVNTVLNGRFNNRSCNYHTGNYTDQSAVVRAMVYGRPFAVFKPTDWGYDNFRDKVNDSRYYKTFQPEYVANSSTGSFSWNANASAWWNINKPVGEPTVTATEGRIKNGKRAIIYIENQRSEALDSQAVMSHPFQFFARWIRSAITDRYYYRYFIDGTGMGLNTGRRNIYLASKKFVDPSRGGSTAETNYDSENGTRDAILMRLAETFLIRAEAYGRKAQYAMAVADINTVRQRAAYKAGESRPQLLTEWEPQAATLTATERQPPYAADGTSVAKLAITEDVFTPGTLQATAEGYIPGIASKDIMFIHYIYNEKAREFLSEGYAWEDLHNAGILFERVENLNQMASSKTGLWPVAFNTESGNGQNGNGKGQFQKFHTFRPWPNSYLVQLTDATGKFLDAAAQTAYQNPGY